MHTHAHMHTHTYTPTQAQTHIHMLKQTNKQTQNLQTHTIKHTPAPFLISVLCVGHDAGQLVSMPLGTCTCTCWLFCLMLVGAVCSFSVSQHLDHSFIPSLDSDIFRFHHSEVSQKGCHFLPNCSTGSPDQLRSQHPKGSYRLLSQWNDKILRRLHVLLH